jgi:hypothetical protein
MTQWSIPWGGTVVGDPGPYSDANWSDVWRKLFIRNRVLQGVLQDYENELEVTTTGNEVVQVDTGAAIVDGKFYETDAVVPLVVAKPGAGDNYYTIVLRKNWIGVDAQTVRVDILGPNIAAPPTVAATQVDGLVWDIALATVKVHNDGITTVTDFRAFAKYSAAFPIAGRQGLYGAYDTQNFYWGSQGANNSVPFGNVICQIGVRAVAIGAGNESGSQAVTFPIPFSTEPFITGNCRGNVAFGVGDKCNPSPAFASLVTGVSMTIWAGRPEGVVGAYTAVVNWIAIGPKA